MSHSGLLITIEGGEGAGKTTQIVRLQKRLLAAGQDVVVLREPGGTSIGEQIRDVVLSSKNVGMAFTTEVLLFQAARAQLFREIVLPSLEAGKVVLMDRSRDSSVVYQGLVRGFGVDKIEELNNLSTKNTYPDLTILLDIDVKTGLQRKIDDQEVNRMEMENKAFHEQVRDSYLQLAKKDKLNRWRVIDASVSLDEIEEQIWQLVKQKLKLK